MYEDDGGDGDDDGDSGPFLPAYDDGDGDDDDVKHHDDGDVYGDGRDAVVTYFLHFIYHFDDGDDVDDVDDEGVALYSL